MNLNKYQVLMNVVKHGSLTKAAEATGYTQSGVSHTINSLEEELGFQLVIRGRTGVKLTKNGEQIMGIIREILMWNEHLEQEVAAIHGIESGTIHIGTFTSVSVHWLPMIINHFQQDFPKIKINLVPGDYRQIENGLINGDIDCGFLSLPTIDQLEVIPLKQDKMQVILPFDHPLSTFDEIPLAELSNEPFIMPQKGSDDDINRVLAAGSFKPHIKFIAGDDHAIMAMVEMGLGISILPELVLRGQHRQILIKHLDENMYRSLGIAVHSINSVSPATKKFISYVQSAL